jgi:hypothetical protein
VHSAHPAAEDAMATGTDAGDCRPGRTRAG